MTRSELVTGLAHRFPRLNVQDADVSAGVILEAVSAALAHGGRVEIRGFGSFELNHRPARVGRNPKSGEKVQVPEKFVPHFKPGKDLREWVLIKAEFCGEFKTPGQTQLRSGDHLAP